MRLEQCIKCGTWELASERFAGWCRGCQPPAWEEREDDAGDGADRRGRRDVSPDRAERHREYLAHREQANRHRTIANSRRVGR